MYRMRQINITAFVRYIDLFYIYIPDAKYVLTFQETGCPGHQPPEKLIERWKSQEKDLVFAHMFKLCNLAKKENMHAEAKEKCCGSNPCKHITCVRQRAFIQRIFIQPTQKDINTWTRKPIGKK